MVLIIEDRTCCTSLSRESFLELETTSWAGEGSEKPELLKAENYTVKVYLTSQKHLSI